MDLFRDDQIDDDQIGLSDDELVERLGLVECNDVQKRYTLAELVDLLDLPRRRVRAWLQAGLIEPIAQEQGTAYFGFGQVVAAKTLCDLADAGVRTDRIRRGLEELRRWLPDADQPLAQLAVLEKNGHLLMRLEQGLVEPSGQLLFEFGDETAILQAQPRTAEQWFDEGVRFEEEGFLADAVHAYREALLIDGPDADVCFNLGNALFALGDVAEASERFRQVVEMDGQFAEAWNNLGVALGQRNRHDEAARAFRRAIELQFEDAHFNLADLLESQGRSAEANQHWLAYLGHNAHGRFAHYARSKLA